MTESCLSDGDSPPGIPYLPRGPAHLSGAKYEADKRRTQVQPRRASALRLVLGTNGTGMKSFLRAIALPLGISIIRPVATRILWRLMLFKALGLQDVNRERLASVVLVVSAFELVATVGLVVWAGWRARLRLRTGIGTAALAGAVVTVVDLIETAALFAWKGRSFGPVVFGFPGVGLLGAVLGTIGGLLVGRFHPELRARPVVPFANVKHFPNRMIAEMARETLEHQGIPSGVVEASAWPVLGADLYVDVDDAARAREIISAMFGDP